MKEITPFTPHSAEELAEGVFPKPLDPVLYQKMVEKFERIDNVVTSQIVYESDGLDVTGIQCMPAEPDGELPLMVFNRGGSRRYGMLTVVQVLRLLAPLAAKGYIVLSTNFRGNDGGDGQEEFGGADVHDVLRLLELSKEMPEWDGKNAYLAGWSRGGMMTYLGLKHGAEVNAAASVAGLADLRATKEERPEMHERVYKPLIPHESDAELWEQLEARSAVCWPEKITVPLLLQHGDADDVVDIAHSEQLASLMEENGQPHKLIRYSGGDHFLNRQMDDVLNEIDAWFKAHAR